MANILLLEDENTIREVIAEYMLITGHKVFEAINGMEAKKILNENNIDIAVLDIMVGEISGIDVLKHIRNNEEISEIGVIMLSALDDINTQVSAFNNYADEYIVKPASPIILIKRIETLLRRVKPTKDVKGEFYIDEKSYKVYVNEDEVPFTLSEFLILNELYKNKGQVLSREQLIMGAFNDDYIGNDRIIDAHIKNIRKKIPKKYIETIIGIGYRFDK